MTVTAPGPATRPKPGKEAGPQLSTLDIFLASIEQKAYRFAFYDLWDREAALDAVQDSMLKLVEHYRDKPANEWPALFFTILRNRVNDTRRWRMLERVRLVFSSLRPDENGVDRVQATSAPLNETPEVQTGAKHLRITLERALKTLPTRQRQVLLLREWQEFSIKETAQILGCSIGTVKQHHFRAMQALRDQLSEVWKHET